jgi:8-oxo-dGTP pyrophosphatase MutT (NUDIX family)
LTIGFDLGAPPVPPRDAATVILVRDALAGGIELFFVKRRANVRFMGGAYVFPGGKLDPEDASDSICVDLDERSCRERLCEEHNPHARALHVAAARECLEEAGVLLAHEPQRSWDELNAMRRAIDVEQRPFAEVLAARGVTLALSRLVPFSRWVTPAGETRRFDARFFLALASRDTSASHDTRETVASSWLSPQDALARAERREIVLVPPTYRTVEQLSRVKSAAEALSIAPTRIAPTEPVVRVEHGRFFILLPDDPEHPTPALDPLGRGFVTRFAYDDGVWSSVR